MFHDKYGQWFEVIASEIKTTLSDAEREKLEYIISSGELAKMTEVFGITREEILSYVLATPLQRDRKRKGYGGKEREFVLKVHSLYMLAMGKSLFDELQALPDGLSYRNFVSKLIGVALRFQDGNFSELDYYLFG